MYVDTVVNHACYGCPHTGKKALDNDHRCRPKLLCLFSKFFLIKRIGTLNDSLTG
jgi:hypothetical protein